VAALGRQEIPVTNLKNPAKAHQQHLGGFLSCVFHSFAMEDPVSSS
jgi:hypothetical protein